MIETWIYAIGSVIVVSLIALIGIITLTIKENTLKKILPFLVSFAVGGLFGGAFLHLLPEMVHHTGFTTLNAIYILLGIISFFILEKFICWRHCHIPTCKEHPHPFALMNLIGDVFHNFIDGLIIGGSYLVSIPLGISTTLAVVIHEIPQEIGDFGVLIHGGYSKKKALLLNFAVALSAIAGTILVLLIGPHVEHIEHFLIPFTAGGFIYIAGSDLIPELHKTTNPLKSLGQLLSLIAGIAVMASVLLFEHGH